MVKRGLILVVLLCWAAGGVYSQQQNAELIETVLQKGHSRYVTCVAFSPDGKLLATGSMDNSIKLWNTQSGKEIRSFAMQTGFIRSLNFSPDGSKLLSASSDNKAMLYEVQSGELLAEFKQKKNRLWKACFSPDGSKVLTMDDRTQLILWDALSGELIKEYKKEYDAEITTHWFTASGESLITINANKKSQLTNLNDSALSVEFNIQKPYSYAVSPTNKVLAIGSSTQHIELFNIETGERTDSLVPNPDKGCNGCKTRIVFSHTGKKLVSVTKYSGVDIWDVRTGEKLLNFPYEESWVDAVAFSSNDRYVMVNADDETVIWDLKLQKKLREFNFDGLECTPVFSPDGKSILTTNENNTAAIWDIETGKKTRVYGGFLNKKRDDGMKFDQGNWYHSGIINYLRLESQAILHPCGRYIVKGNIDSVAVLINLETGKVERQFVGHRQAVLCTDFSSDGKWLVTGSGDRRIKLWNVETGELIRTYKGHGELVFDVSFSADDAYLVSGSWDGTLRMWDVATGKLLSYVNIEESSPFRTKFTPNDLYVVSADLTPELKLYEADAAAEFRNIVGHTKLVTDINFSLDGRSMITASDDGTVKEWDLLSGMLIRKYKGHQSGVYAVVYHPNGKYVVSGSNDRTVIIWNAQTGAIEKELQGHSGGVSSVQISEDGKRLVSCTVDGEVKVWNLNTYEELYTYIQIDRENWLAKTPEGYFDGSPNALKHINYVSGTEVIAVNALFEKYYTPNLVKRLTAGESFQAKNMNFNEVIQAAPSVQLNLIEENTLKEELLNDSIVWFRKSLPLAVNLTDNGRGIDEVRVYNNGKLVQNEWFSDKQVRAGKQHSLSVDVPMLTGVNKVTVVALNKDRTESEPIELEVYYDGVESNIDLYILSVGINKYKNPAYELNYAVNDAKAYSRQIQKSAGAIFNEVDEVFIKDTDASKEGIQQAFMAMAEKSGPEDVFIFYYAGHGAMNDDTFFIVPYDVTNMYGDAEGLEQKAISSAELLQFSKEIAAGKQMFILDACQSGGALEAFNTRGAEREKAVAQLARSTGTFFLLASGAIQYASEARELGHGIFTYALLEGLQGEANGGIGDEKITANELKSYVEDRVPELTDEYMLTPQYPTGYGYGQDFPLVILKD